MAAGFFASADISGRTTLGSPKCGACGLHAACESPKVPVTGKGRRGILVVAGAPDKKEDVEGVQLVGKSGQLFRSQLAVHSIDLDEDCWKINAVICKPKDGKPPSDAEIEYCRPNVVNTISSLKPRVIILLGPSAVKSVISYLYGARLGVIDRWVGWKIPCRKPNAWVCPMHHPSYLLQENNEVLNLWFARYLKEAASLLGRPWIDLPDYESEVERIHDVDRAAHIVRKMIERGGTAAWDYETNMLKPDSEAAQIVSCAICWEGKKTIAYPWHGEAVRATSEFLRSKRVVKVGWNAKFEQRWTRRVLGHGVRGWHWDGMLAAHILDNRPGITGAKFQAFVKLGQPSYDGSVGAYLKAGGSNKENRIREVNIRDLLLYNGMDARVEYEIAVRQMEEMGCRG